MRNKIIFRTDIRRHTFLSYYSDVTESDYFLLVLKQTQRGYLSEIMKNNIYHALHSLVKKIKEKCDIKRGSRSKSLTSFSLKYVLIFLQHFLCVFHQSTLNMYDNEFTHTENCRRQNIAFVRVSKQQAGLRKLFSS